MRDDTVTEPISLTLSARNLYAWVVLAQFFLLVNGEYLYRISATAVGVYLFGPATLIVGMITMTKTSAGKPLTWESMEKSLLARKDRLSEYLRAAGWSVQYFSVGVQLIYFCLAAGISGIVFMFMIMQGLITPQITPVGMTQAAIISNLILIVPSETMMFHGIVPYFAEMTFKKSQYCQVLMYIVSQAVFAVFHISAYGGSLGGMMFIFAFGIVLLYAARNYGLPMAAGIHFAWNMAVLGILLPGA